MQKYQLTKDEMYSVLDNTRSGVISTIGSDGYPYSTPINFVRIDDDIYFHGRKTGEKVSNLSLNQKCCFTTFEEGGFERYGDDACNTTSIYKSVIIRGIVEEIKDNSSKMQVLRKTVDKLTPERRYDEINAKSIEYTSVFKINIKSMTGKYHRPEPNNKIYI